MKRLLLLALCAALFCSVGCKKTAKTKAKPKENVVKSYINIPKDKANAANDAVQEHHDRMLEAVGE